MSGRDPQLHARTYAFRGVSDRSDVALQVLAAPRWRPDRTYVHAVNLVHLLHPTGMEHNPIIIGDISGMRQISGDAVVVFNKLAKQKLRLLQSEA